ncbi:MAG: peptidoglycan-binding protein [Pauljensenia sp.]
MSADTAAGRGDRKPWVVVGSILAVVVMLSVAFWAGRVVAVGGSAEEAQSDQLVTVTVSEQEIGRAFTLNVTVTQDQVPLAANLLTGVVTTVSDAAEFHQGDALYAVAGTPVRVVKGSTPFYRDLVVGERGIDVAQLEQALVDLGYLGTADEVFDSWTESAVKAWQKDLGTTQSGQVALGELVAVEDLPASLFVDSTVARPGLVLQGDEDVVSQAAGSPSFALEVNEAQARAIPSTSSVEVTYEDQVWPAVISGFQRDDAQGSVNLTLTSPDGGVVCGGECAVLPRTEKSYLAAKVQVVAPQKGPAVPVAALRTQPDGTVSVSVVGADGTVSDREVTVLASLDGLAVVTGVSAGEVVQVFASTTQTVADTSTGEGGESGTSTDSPTGDQSGTQSGQ